jgi:two-component system, NarL family, nitrate/nitrite response regulator NarL
MAMTLAEHRSLVSPRAALVVDRHRLFAEVMTPFLEDMRFAVSVATETDTAHEAISSRMPTLTLVDLSLPAEDCLRLGRDALTATPGAIVIGTTPEADPRLVRATKEVGFWGCLSKELPLSRFTANIRAAIEGQPVAERRPLYERPPGAHYERPRDLLAAQLTPRELEVLALLVEGAGSARIADQLDISWNTVRTHAQSILTKLQVHSRLEAAAVAVQQSLVPDPASRLADARPASALHQP